MHNLVSGFITWQEFHIQFLVSQGHSETSAIQQASDYEAIPLEAQGNKYPLGIPQGVIITIYNLFVLRIFGFSMRNQ